MITGASGGIGQATARALAEEGWNLYLHFNRNEAAVVRLAKELECTGAEIIPVQADLASEEGSARLVQQIFSVDAIVYASGAAPYGLFSDIGDEMMEDMIRLHVKSPFRLVRDLLPKLKGKNKADIVLISSIWGQTGAACEVLYSALKGAQIAFAKALAKEMAGSSINVNAIAPGAVRTSMLSGYNNEELRSLEEEIPAGRLAEPAEIADAVTFLLSGKSTYITGQVLAVNGGWYT